MKYRHLISFICIIGSMLCGSRLFAEGTVGISGATFLEYAIGSRALGMGEAFTAQSTTSMHSTSIQPVLGP